MDRSVQLLSNTPIWNADRYPLATPQPRPRPRAHSIADALHLNTMFSVDIKPCMSPIPMYTNPAATDGVTERTALCPPGNNEHRRSVPIFFDAPFGGAAAGGTGAAGRSSRQHTQQSQAMTSMRRGTRPSITDRERQITLNTMPRRFQRQAGANQQRTSLEQQPSTSTGLAMFGSSSLMMNHQAPGTARGKGKSAPAPGCHGNNNHVETRVCANDERLIQSVQEEELSSEHSHSPTNQAHESNESDTAAGTLARGVNDRIERLDAGRQPESSRNIEEPQVDDQPPFVGFGPPLRTQFTDNEYRGYDTNSQYSYYQQFYKQQQEARNLAEMLQATKLRPAGRERQRKAEDSELTSSPIFHSFVRPCAAEFLGTIFYVYFTSFGRPFSPRPSEIVCIGLVRAVCTMVSMLLFGHISGGHFNPAITLTAWLSGGIKSVLVIFYIICQFFGAFIAALLVRVSVTYTGYDDIQGGMTYVPVHDLRLATETDNSPSRLQAILLELIITYVLCTAYALTVVDTDGRCGVEGAGAVGGAVVLGTLAAYDSTRASMNPAKSFACACVYAIFRPETSNLWDYHYVYWLGPICGALLAAAFYRCLLGSDDKRLLFTRELQKSDQDNDSNKAEAIDAT